MYIRLIARKLNLILEQRTGCKIGEQFITTDRCHCDTAYIPQESLKPGHPLILSHYMGVRLVFIPYQDWELLTKWKVSPEKYVDNSVWNYGYYWGKNAFQTGGVFWQPLENGKPGIKNREKIKKYLTMLMCRGYEVSSQEAPHLVWCSDCHLQKCPHSVVRRKKCELSADDEVVERNVHKELYDKLSAKLKGSFDLEVASYGISKEFNGIQHVVYVFKGYKPRTVKILTSESLFVDMMYNAGNYDMDAFLESCAVVACVNSYNQNAGQFILAKTMAITDETSKAEVDNFFAT